jgi:hypothetical protein
MGTAMNPMPPVAAGQLERVPHRARLQFIRITTTPIRSTPHWHCIPRAWLQILSKPHRHDHGDAPYHHNPCKGLMANVTAVCALQKSWTRRLPYLTITTGPVTTRFEAANSHCLTLLITTTTTTTGSTLKNVNKRNMRGQLGIAETAFNSVSRARAKREPFRDARMRQHTRTDSFAL